MTKAVILIDGGHVRALAKKVDLNYDPDFIEKVAHSCITEGETLIRGLRSRPAAVSKFLAGHQIAVPCETGGDGDRGS